MGALTGLQPIRDYAGAANDPDRVQLLLDLIPDPDTPTPGSGAVAAPPHGVENTYLDEMSPGAAAALRVELIAMKASVT